VKGLIVLYFTKWGLLGTKVFATATAKVAEDVEDNVKDNVSQFQQFLNDCQEAMVDFVSKYWLRIIGAIVIFLIGRKIISVISKLVQKALEKSSVELTVCKFLHRVISVVLYLVLIVSIASCLGVDTAAFVTVLGAASLAVGLALQGTFSNFAGGVLILLLKPFKVNDFIINGDVEGKVKAIDIFYTKIITPDNKKVVIPNGQLANSVTRAIPETSKRRIDLLIPVDYGADIKKVRDVLNDIAKNTETIKQSNGIGVTVDNLDASAITIGFRVWVASADYHSEVCYY